MPWATLVVAVCSLAACAPAAMGASGAAPDGGPDTADAGAPADDARAPGDGGASLADAGLGDGGPAADAEAIEPRVPIFVGYGHGVRTTISCDDGRTWVANQVEKETDDDFTHDETAAHDLLFADGAFVIQIGWGGPARIRRSEDGVAWTETLARGEGLSLWGGAAGQGVFVFGEGRRTRRSLDGARTWEPEVAVEPAASHMQIGWGDHDGGRFVAAGDAAIHWSDDGGAIWQPSVVPDEARACLAQKRGPFFGGGVFVISSAHGAVCRSEDGGETWTGSTIGADDVGTVLWDGTAFYTYRWHGAFRSEDAETWTAVEWSGDVTRFDAIARSAATGTILALSGGNLYRSEDAVRWERQPAEVLAGAGSRLERIAFGWARPTAECPLP